nr:lipase [Actinomycetales bacterium]
MTLLERTYGRYVRRLPRWGRVLLGLVCVAGGALLVVSPFRSLGVLVLSLVLGLALFGIGEVTRAEGGWPGALTGLASLAAGILVLVLPGLTIGGIVLLVGASLILTALSDAAEALRGGGDERVARLMLAVSTLVLGIVALAWPDVTVFVVAALFGVRLLLFGLDHVVAAFRGRPAEQGGRPGRPWRRTAGAALALLGSLALLFLGVRLSGTPQPDAFYSAPATVPEAPGHLLRSETFTRTIPEGASAWRILYTSTAHDGSPALASALVVVPDGVGAPPVIAWAHGTTGWATGCAPSLLEEPFVSGAMPGLDAVLERGWAVVATDYTGLGTDGVHPYLIGTGEAYGVLDAVRAAQQLAEAGLGADTVVWGHSQGGHAALWTAGLAPDYAPELELLGVAA